MSIKVLRIEDEGVVVFLPGQREELWRRGEIIDDTFPNSSTRRSRVQTGDMSPTITATGLNHLFYLEDYKSCKK